MKQIKYIFSIIALLMCLSAEAQRVSVDVPNEVLAGENFRVKFSVSNADVQGINMGKLPNGLNLLYGPSTSVKSSYSSVNGNTSRSSSVTFTYVMSAKKTGSYTIPAVTIQLGNGKTISSGRRTISVIKNLNSRNNSSGNNATNNNNNPFHDSYVGEKISNNDVFVSVTANKKNVYEQEAVYLTYKVYYKYPIQLERNKPDIEGLLIEEVNNPANASYSLENVKGHTYKSQVLGEYIVYPQKSGDIVIPSLSFKGVVFQKDPNMSDIDIAFNGGLGYVEKPILLKTTEQVLHVKPLTDKPANFSGGVGKFAINAHLDKKEVAAGNAVTLRIEVSGRGNLKLLTAPEPMLPKGFDKYDPKITDNTEMSREGASGTMVYDIIIVPRNMGKYEIPSFDFVYFDTQEGNYKTLKTEKLELNVLKGDGSSAVDDYSNLKNRDIFGIKTGSAEHRNIDNLFFGSNNYLIVLAITSFIFIALLIIFRRRAIENADIVKLKGKRANSVAVKRLRKADKLMKSGLYGEFFDEVLRALWGYVSDKLNMPSATLLRENVEQNLTEHGVGAETVEKFIKALDECEFERYAPGDKSVNMNKTFESAMTAIMEIETDMRNKKKKSSKSLVILMFLLLMPCAMNAAGKADADAYYTKGNYEQAVQEYEKLLKNGESAELYYNLGNAYYRLDNFTRAVINYERALLLSPGDSDIKFNLELARSKTADKMAPPSEMFFVTMYKSLVNFMSVDGWAVTAIVSIILSLILVLFYLFASGLKIRKVGFYGSAILLLLFIFSNLFAYQQKEQMTDRTGAIIISTSTQVHKTPSETSGELMILHEGARVEIKDDTMKEWYGVELSDGTEGWVKKETVEVI